MASLHRIANLIKASTSLFLVILLLKSSSCIEAENVLYPGQSLRSGESLTHGSNYALKMQSYCNLVLYDAGNAVWASNTAERGRNCSCSVLKTGELVIRDSKGDTVWRNGVTGKEGTYALVLQRDRNVVVYGPSIWTTKTNTAKIAQVVAAA